jgi:hypothetical protein
MNLKDFLTSRDNPPELFWSLVLEEGWVQAGVWYIKEKAAEVVSVGPPTAWGVEDELIGAADAALSSAIQKLPENYTEPTKTVFGVSASWVEGGEITQEHLAEIKKLCAELSLNPIGFVVLPEAIAHLHKAEEGAPLSAIILRLGEEYLEISVFKLGNLSGTTKVARSISLVEDVTEGLSRFESASPLPSRIIVYDGKEGELEEAKEALMQAPWNGEAKIKFLHTPKAEVLSSDRKVLATCLAGAAEVGDVSRVVPEQPLSEEKEGVEVKGETLTEGVAAEDLGFAIGKDVSAQRREVENAVPASPRADFNPPKKTAEYYLQKTKNIFHSFSLKLTVSHPKNTTLLGILTVGLLVLLIGGVFWWFYPTAKVTIFVIPKRYEQQVQVFFNTDGEYDVSTGILPARVITDEVSGEKTKGTTGSKLIGNKATGSVQIANGNGSSINLAAGTILNSSAGLKFVTNSEASVSGQILPGSPGTAVIDVTAADIGSQYNLAKGEIFGVGNYSKALVAGTSMGDFSGGSSQEITAVSKDDQVNLENDLKAELGQNVKSDILSKVTNNEIFVDNLVGLDITSESFDHKIGDSADSLKLSLTLNATGLAADKIKLLEYSKGVLKDQIPSGFVLKNEQIDFKFSFIDLKNGEYNYNMTIGANFLPQVDSTKIIKQIVGKTPEVVKKYLSSIPGFSRAEVVLKPNLPGFLGTLPRVPKNITIETAAEQ